MLDPLIPEYVITTTYGSSVLKALQNDNLPEIDLLVREAVQNSTDAAIGLSGNSSRISFNTGSFRSSQFNALLTNLTEELDRRFPEETSAFLEIRDSKTSGLTGAVTINEALKNEDDHGNYFKLVFESGQEQTNSSVGQAGGSWGYGKSVYYRAGVGLVVFYTQIRVSKGFESRLIVSLVESDKTSESMLKTIQSNSVGRAWWGIAQGAPDGEILPLTDKKLIKDVLDIFGLQPFDAEETGTSIIIPYIDEKRLLSGIFPDDCQVSEDEKQMCSWKDNLAEYIELSLQRWYAPKLFNEFLDLFPNSKRLAAWVNSKAIRKKDMRPLFQLIQELYNVALGATEGVQYTPQKFDDIKQILIKSNRIDGNRAGYVATIRATKSDLSATGSMISPYTYLRLFNKSSYNDPIVMFARTPGLVLDYKIEGKWAHGLSKPGSDDEYIISFYVPNCEAKLKDDSKLGKFGGMALGEYLRKCEKSDHMDWEDSSGLTVIGNIKRYIVRKINELSAPEEEVVVAGTVSRLSSKLGKKLLPTINYGKERGSRGGGGASSGGGKVNNLLLRFDRPEIVGSLVDLHFSAEFFNTKQSASIGFFVEAEYGSDLDAAGWKSKVGTDFPLNLLAISDCTIFSKDDDRICSFEHQCDPNGRTASSELGVIGMDWDESCSSFSGFTIKNTIRNAIVSGTLQFELNDRRYSFEFKEISHVGGSK